MGRARIAVGPESGCRLGGSGGRSGGRDEILLRRSQSLLVRLMEDVNASLLVIIPTEIHEK